MRGFGMGFGVICLAAHFAALGQTYKCTDAKGVVSFQGTPCTAEKIQPKVEKDARPATATPNEPPQSDAERRREASRLWEERMKAQREELAKRPIPKEALNQGVAVAPKPKKPAIGMTADAVLDIWGKPDKVNRTTTGRGVKEQWVYQRIYGSYVYVDNGIVTAIQESK